MRDYQWNALLKVYDTGEAGLLGDRDCWNYGNIGWGTWQRLLNYKSGALVVDRDVSVCKKGFQYEENRLFLTEYGSDFVKQHRTKYEALYPDLEAMQLRC